MVEKSGKRNRKILWIVLVIEVICLAGLVIVFLVNNDEEEPVKVDSLIDMASEAIQAVKAVRIFLVLPPSGVGTG